MVITSSVTTSIIGGLALVCWFRVVGVVFPCGGGGSASQSFPLFGLLVTFKLGNKTPAWQLQYRLCDYL